MAPIKPQPDPEATADASRHDRATPTDRSSSGAPEGRAASPARFNILLAEERSDRGDQWAQHFSRLLEPQGVSAFVARSGREALEISAELPIHAAVVDLTTPREPRQSASAGPGGLWLLEVLNRQPARPPVVMLNGQTYSARQAQRILNQALRLGAFSVLNRPVELERLLLVIQRLVDREYHGAWPDAYGPDPGQNAQTPTPAGQRRTTFRFTINVKTRKRS